MAISKSDDSAYVLRRLLPSLSVGLLGLLQLARLPLIEWLPVTPAFAFIAIFYWSFVRPERLPLWLLFVVGLIVDSVGPLALGTHSLVFLVFHFACRAVRRRIEKLSLPVMWLLFALLFGAAVVTLGACASLELNNIPSLRLLGIYWLCSAAAYPLLHLAFDRLLAWSLSWKL